MSGKNQRGLFWFFGIQYFYLTFSAISAFAQDPLPSWVEGQTTQQILDFVRDVTTSPRSLVWEEIFDRP